MGCRRMLGVEDRAAIMAGLEAGLSQVCIAHLIGRSPSVVCREIARHTGPDGQYRAEEAGKAARAARRRPKKRLLDCDEILRDRVIADLSQGHTPRQISGRLREEACGTLPSMDTSPDAQGHTISHEAIYTWIYAHPKKTLIEHGICLPSRRWMRKKPPASGRKPPIVGMRLIDERPDISDRKIPGNWEGDLIIGQDGASACATLVERTTRYLIIVALPLGRKADQVCDALTRRIQGLPDQAMRTLTWDQGREMARHQRLTPGTGVEVFFAHPHSPWERGTNENTNRLIRRYLPKGTPITSHQPYLDAIAYELNNCPRATLDYRTPTEAFNELIATTHCHRRRLVTGRDSENALESQDAPEYDFEDTVVGQLRDAFGEVGAAFGFGFGKSGQQQKSSVERVSTKCSGCHAPITGVKGKTAVCKYCDTEQVL